jgi:Tfp pilus assembly PilM family ATPase
MPSSAPESRSHGPTVVVEVGSDWLKVVQVESSRNRPVVSKLYLAQIRDPATSVSQLLADALKKLKFAVKPVIACLPRQTVNVRMLDLPSTDPQEIVDMVDLQAAKQTPYSAEEIVSDYRVGGGARTGYTRVLLAIAQRSVLRQRFYVLDEAGVEVDRTAVSSEGLLGWYRHVAGGGGAAGATAVLDVDASYADFAVISQGDIVFTKSIMIGAFNLLGEYGKWAEKFVREVQQACEILQGESPDATVSRVVLTGAGPNVPGLAEALNGQMGIPVEPVPCDKGVKMEAAGVSLADDAYRAVSIAPLIGVALAADELALDLMPDTVRSKKDVLRKARTWSAFGVLLLGALVSVSLFVTTSFFLKRQRLNRLRAESLRTEPAVRQMEQRKEIVKLVQGRDDSRLLVVSLIEKIHGLTGDVYLDAVDYDAEKSQVSLEGTAKTIKDVSGLVQKLEQSPLFSDVREGKPTSVDPKGRFRFQVVCGLEAKP